MNYTSTLIVALIVCGLCIASVSAVPVIVGFRDTPRISADSLNGITLMTVAATRGDSSVSDVSVGISKVPVTRIFMPQLSTFPMKRLQRFRQAGR